MSVKIIDEGNKNKKGNATCPNCGTRVLIESHWGDLPKCPDCNVPYYPDLPHVEWH